MGGGRTRVGGGDARGGRAVPGTRPSRESDVDRSRGDFGVLRSVGGRCHRRNGRRTSPPRDGRSPPTIGGAAPAAERKSAPAPVSCRPRAHDRRTARSDLYSQGPVHVTECVTFASGVFASHASPGRVGRDPSGRRWTAPRGPREKARARSRSASGNRHGAKREGRTRTHRGWTGRQP